MRKAPAEQVGAKERAATLPVPPPDVEASKGRAFKAPPATTDASRDELMAQFASGGIVGNARTLVAFAQGTFGELSLTDCAKALKDTADGLNGGDLSAAVTMLSCQALALNAMFGELARRAASNIGQHLEASDRYMRLALKAQGQCRATLETIATIKNPPVLFARQANINNGGQQQVNNGAQPTRSGSPAPAPAHASNPESEPNRLLEATDGERLDVGTSAATSKSHPRLVPVGEVNRPTD